MGRKIRENIIGRELGITQRSWKKCKESGLTPDPVGRSWAGGNTLRMVDTYDLDVLQEWVKNTPGVIRYVRDKGRNRP